MTFAVIVSINNGLRKFLLFLAVFTLNTLNETFIIEWDIKREPIIVQYWVRAEYDFFAPSWFVLLVFYRVFRIRSAKTV